MQKIFVTLALFATFACASSGSMAADIAAGKSRSAQCAACHGADGHSVAPMAPSLAGQDEDYLVKQLNDFHSGARQDETMSVIAKQLNDTEIADLAAYFHSQK